MAADEPGQSHDGSQNSSDSCKVPPTLLQSALIRVRQMLALLDTPLAQGQAPARRPSVQDGLIYGLSDLLTPMDTIMRLSASKNYDIVSPMNTDAAASTPGPEALARFVQTATGMLQVADQLSSLLDEPVHGENNNLNALELLKNALPASPLSPAEQQDVVLRMRKKRRAAEGSLPENSDAEKEPVPSKKVRPSKPHGLSFITTNTPLEAVLQSPATELKDSLEKLIDAFNLMQRDICGQEKDKILGPNGQRFLPTHRVRARVAHWSDNAAEVQVELRDVGLVTIHLRLLLQHVNVVDVGMRAPSEYASIVNTTNSLLPSKYALYNEISSHLLVYALHYQDQNDQWLEALGQTLLQVAGLRTLYDPEPTAVTPVLSLTTRTACATLSPENLLDHTRMVVWKWCRLPGASAGDDGDWCAFASSFL